MQNPGSIQVGVFRLGLLEDRDFGVSIFPQGEEFLISSLCFGLVSRQSERPAQLQVRQRADGFAPHRTGVIENLLEFSNCRAAPCFAARYASPRT